MFRFFRKDKQGIIDDAAKSFNEQLDGLKISRILDENVTLIKRLFKDVDILRTRYIENKNDSRLKYCIMYCEGVVDTSVINENIIKPLMLSEAAEAGKGLLDELTGNVLQISDVKKTESIADIVDAISYGETVLFADGAKQALTLETKNFTQRAIAEPESEKNIAGPREGFTESLMTNLSMLRRKVRTHELKMKFITLGRRTQTKICICYMDSIVNKKVLQELLRRLDTVDIDAVLDTNYITELIKDTRATPFRTIGFTEKPDTVIGKLLEGRIAIIADGTPSALTLPYLLVENFQTGEDYYMNYYYSTFSRILRIIGFLLTVLVPATYVALAGFHQEMFPTQLLLNLAAERTGVPLPASIEAFILVIVFDLLRETSVRMPSSIGQPLSIVGALVIGQAAVEARFIAAAMIIVIALTGVTNLLVPRMSAPVIILRLGLLFLGATFGLYGLMLGVSVIIIHLINLRSFGIPQISLTANLKSQELKDTFFRAPWWRMRQRPKFAWNKTRIKTEDKQ